VAEAFRGHVSQGAHKDAGAGQFGGGRTTRDAEVDQVDEVLAGHQRIRRFDVAVHQSSGVGSTEGGGQLLNDVHGAAGIHWPVAYQQSLDVGAFDDRHHQIQPAVDITGVVDGDDVRLGQPGCGVGLAAEPLPISRVGPQVGGQQFDGDVAVDRGVVGPIHLPHAALADQRQQPVTPKHHLIHRVGPPTYPGQRCYRPAIALTSFSSQIGGSHWMLALLMRWGVATDARLWR
jgi:hypothetical protein